MGVWNMLQLHKWCLKYSMCKNRLWHTSDKLQNYSKYLLLVAQQNVYLLNNYFVGCAPDKNFLKAMERGCSSKFMFYVYHCVVPLHPLGQATNILVHRRFHVCTHCAWSIKSCMCIQTFQLNIQKEGLSVPFYTWKFLLLIIVVKAKYFLCCSLSQEIVLSKHGDVRSMCRERR